MSIYCSMHGLSGWEDDGEQPYVYDGSHVVVGPDSDRGGAIDWAVPASHIPTAAEPRDSYHDDRWPKQHSYIRLGVTDVEGRHVMLVLDRSQVRNLTEQWREWLDGEFIDDGFPA